MASDHDIADFIRGSFGSIWTLELILKLAAEPEKSWTPAELIASLRASELVVGRALHELDAAGLIVVEPENMFRYGPASEDLAIMIEAVAARYARSPDKIRRVIVAARTGNLNAFAEAFRIRKDAP